MELHSTGEVQSKELEVLTFVGQFRQDWDGNKFRGKLQVTQVVAESCACKCRTLTKVNTVGQL